MKCRSGNSGTVRGRKQYRISMRIAYESHCHLRRYVAVRGCFLLFVLGITSHAAAQSPSPIHQTPADCPLHFDASDSLAIVDKLTRGEIAQFRYGITSVVRVTPLAWAYQIPQRADSLASLRHPEFTLTVDVTLLVAVRALRGNDTAVALALFTRIFMRDSNSTKDRVLWGVAWASRRDRVRFYGDVISDTLWYIQDRNRVEYHARHDSLPSRDLRWFYDSHLPSGAVTAFFDDYYACFTREGRRPAGIFGIDCIDPLTIAYPTGKMGWRCIYVDWNAIARLEDRHK